MTTNTASSNAASSSELDVVSVLPALCDLSTGMHHPLGHTAVFLVGRHPTANLVLLDVTCSRQQFRIVHQSGQFFLEPLSANVPTRCDGQVANGPVVLRHESLIEAGASRFRFLEHGPKAVTPNRKSGVPAAPPPIPVRAVPAAMRTIVGAAADAPETVVPLRPFVLSGQMVIGRDPIRAQIVLPHPRISRIHARITLQHGTALLTDLHSANGTFVNGRRLVGAAVIRPDDRIDIGPYALVFDGQALLPKRAGQWGSCRSCWRSPVCGLAATTRPRKSSRSASSTCASGT